MSVDSNDIERRIDKGKARARSPEPTESTPLLGSTSGSYTSRDEPEPTPRRLFPKLVSVFLVSLSSCLLLLILIILVVYSLRSRAVSASPDQILQHALVTRGPDRVDFLNTTGDGAVWILVRARVGLDAGEVVGVNTVAEDNFLQDLWKSMGRWGIKRLDRVSVNLSMIEITPENDPSHPLVNITLPPLELSLTSNPPPDDTWLTPVVMPVLIRPTKDMNAVKRFLRESWSEGAVRINALVDNAVVQGGGLEEDSWRRLIKVMHSDIRTKIHITIPRLPGLPIPGRNSPVPDFNQLVTLQSFHVTSIHDTLSISAKATVINPVPEKFKSTTPSLPFTVSLPAVNASTDVPYVPIANITTQPFTLTHPNISLSIYGNVFPLPRNSSATLSSFLTDYISARDSDILLSTSLLPDLTVNAKFPAPQPKPMILRNVTIRDMKIKPLGSGMVASGTVLACVVLPRGIEVGLDVTKVFPDVIVYDGPVPVDGEAAVTSHLPYLNFSVTDDDPDLPPAPSLPDPLPERAFAHIRPEDWLASASEPMDSGEGEGSAVAVSAKIVDVPLEVLPGREREFSNFVSKVIFGPQGAVAGVQGVAAVAVHVHGLPFENGRDGEMKLTGLPFQGSVRIGKRTLPSETTSD